MPVMGSCSSGCVVKGVWADAGLTGAHSYLCLSPGLQGGSFDSIRDEVRST